MKTIKTRNWALLFLCWPQLADPDLLAEWTFRDTSDSALIRSCLQMGGELRYHSLTFLDSIQVILWLHLVCVVSLYLNAYLQKGKLAVWGAQTQIILPITLTRVTQGHTIEQPPLYHSDVTQTRSPFKVFFTLCLDSLSHSLLKVTETGHQTKHPVTNKGLILFGCFIGEIVHI